VVLEFPGGRDDYLDRFYPQAGTQLDGFLHITEPGSGLAYNANPGTVGIETFAARGIAGRGVLLDLARWAENHGQAVDWRERRPFTVRDLEDCAAWQEVDILEGTILLLRAGWQSGWEAASEEARREAVAHEPPVSPGLESSSAIPERLWDWGVALVACDNVALEAFPPQDHLLHIDLLVRLGIPIGELWLVDELAAACASEHRFEFLVTCAPLNVRGGVGSTANALAIL
jgi:kynurenine formamidase